MDMEPYMKESMVPHIMIKYTAKIQCEEGAHIKKKFYRCGKINHTNYFCERCSFNCKFLKSSIYKCSQCQSTFCLAHYRNHLRLNTYCESKSINISCLTYSIDINCWNAISEKKCRSVASNVHGRKLKFLLNETDQPSEDTTKKVVNLKKIRWFMKAPTLIQMNFNEFNLGIEGMTILSEELKLNTSLKILDLEYCEIKKEGAIKLGEALKVNKTLNSLGILIYMIYGGIYWKMKELQ